MSIVTELDLLKYRRTKIIATVGPASAAPDRLEELIAAGVNVFRVNMSHGEHAGHAEAIAMIRAAAASSNATVAILADLCGPKIRTGKFAGGKVTIATGADVTLTAREVLGDEQLIPSQYAAIINDVEINDRILLNDGAVEMIVQSRQGEELSCQVIAGGEVGDHKGINLPGSRVSAPSLTEKDREDAQFALDQKVDFLALSFVRRGEDIRELRELMNQHGAHAGIIAKIEKPEALTNSDDIIAQADGIMVARGDLGVELNPEQVPLAQAQLIERAKAANKPVIVATQMLESMITQARPTRAEVSDVSLAVASGADAVMLSGESAVGAHPVEAVSMMDRIARQTESYHWHAGTQSDTAKVAHAQGATPFGDAIADATAKLVRDVRARAVLVISMRGMTATTISAARPDAPVIAVSNDPAVCRRMNLLWGIVPYLAEHAGQKNPNKVAREVAQALGIGQTGEHIVMVRGFHSESELNSPSITLLEL